MKEPVRKSLLEKLPHLEGLTAPERNALYEALHERIKYGIVWEYQTELIEERMKEELPVLRELSERAVLPKSDGSESIPWEDETEAPDHVLIEGDNLPALTALTYTHAGRVDVIYIDPPYNTGKKDDFIYNDKMVGPDDAFRHSKWLSFMARRLRIAKQLLSERGVIFISIDDNEQANLKLLCDSIFGDKNFVGTYFWKKTSTPPALSYKIRRKLEFVLCYQKTAIPKRVFSQGFVDGGDVPLLNSGNPKGVLMFPKGTVHFNIPDGVYSYNEKHKIEIIDSVVVVNGKNANQFSAIGNFKWSQANLEREVCEGTYFLIKTDKFSPRFQKSTKAMKVPSNIIDEDVNVGTNEDAQKEFLELNLSQSFEYTKPASLIAYLMRIPFWEDKDITILDFFAGSGTTLHATMQLNAEDGGHRQCILVTNNENGICENVTYERCRRVIEGYTTPNGKQVQGLRRNRLRYFQVGFVQREPTLRNRRALMEASTDMLCIKEGLYAERDRLGRLRLRRDRMRYFAADDGRAMLVVYREEEALRIVEEIRDSDLHWPVPLKVYIFSPNDYAFDDDFDEVADRVELCALPEAILNAYRYVLPRRRERTLAELEAEAKNDTTDTENTDDTL